jgi:catechol 2,3-dioxygenase
MSTIPTAAETTSGPSIAHATTIGTVRLNVSDLDRSRAFYEHLLGMRAVERDDGSVALGTAADAPPLLVITGNGGEPRLDQGRTGLYHFAVLVPSRRDLAVSLVRLAQGRWPLSGASDHLVSEALYLDDPDGIGIEIYRDRDRSEWRHDQAGQLEMSTLPLDIDGVVGELSEAPVEPEADLWLPVGTRMGHVHLQVSELANVERFYSQVLGFDVMVRGYPGALFVSAGGYHHHIGLNTWHSRGSSAPEPAAVGLESYEIRLPDQAALTAVLGRVDAVGLPISLIDGGPSALVSDPSSNAVVLTA